MVQIISKDISFNLVQILEMLSNRRSHGNEKRAKYRNKCRVRLSQHIYEKLGIRVAPADIRLKPSQDDPYRWLPLPSTEYLLEKQLSKSSIRDYQEICDAIDDSALEAVPVDNLIPRQMSRGGYLTRTTDKIETGQTENFAMRVIQLTAEIDTLQTIKQEWEIRAQSAEVQLQKMRDELQVSQALVERLQVKTHHLEQKIQESHLMIENFANDSSHVLKSLIQGMEVIVAN
ncbi:hypothetical protein FQN57_003540 [Myotisia sp. PD_48]|nr:hypothetical protein FQN57_003540 [Myotisia sp. PD_48]